jgi:hypothetical protein
MDTTWPPDWAERVKGKDCPMCAQGRPLDFPKGERPEIPADRLRRDALALRSLV